MTTFKWKSPISQNEFPALAEQAMQNLEWLSTNGRKIPIEKMNEVHLANTIRLLVKRSNLQSRITWPFFLCLLVEAVSRDVKLCEYCRDRFTCLMGEMKCSPTLKEVYEKLMLLKERKEANKAEEKP